MYERVSDAETDFKESRSRKDQRKWAVLLWTLRLEKKPIRILEHDRKSTNMSMVMKTFLVPLMTDTQAWRCDEWKAAKNSAVLQQWLY